MKIIAHTKRNVTVRLTRREVERLMGAVESLHGHVWGDLLLARDTMDGLVRRREVE